MPLCERGCCSRTPPLRTRFERVPETRRSGRAGLADMPQTRIAYVSPTQPAERPRSVVSAFCYLCSMPVSNGAETAILWGLVAHGVRVGYVPDAPCLLHWLLPPSESCVPLWCASVTVRLWHSSRTAITPG